MDPRTGKLHLVDDETDARQRGLMPVRRELTHKEKMEMQIRLYAPCACGSGRKFKFCCRAKEVRP